METVIKTIDNFNYLKLVSFKDFSLWDVKRYLNTNEKFFRFRSVRLKNILKQFSNFEKVKDFELYNLCGVSSWGNGIFHRELKKGSEIKGKKLNKIKEGLFIYSRLGAHNGAFDYISSKFDEYYVTNEFPVFSLDKCLKVEFLTLLFKSNYFWNNISLLLQGSAHKRFKEDLFLDFEIPLPSLSEQEEMLADYNAKMQEAERLEREVDPTYQQVQTELKKRLGLVVEAQSLTKNKLLLVCFKNLSRWDTLFLSGGIPEIKSGFKTVRFSDVVKCLNSNYGKSIRVNSINFPTKDYHYIGMEHIEKETGVLIEMPVVKGKEIKSQTLSVPKNFFLFGKLRPYLNKYWINNTDFEDIICSSELLVFDIDREIVTEDFFKHILSSVIIQTQIRDKTSGARMPRINERVFMNLEFPLPSIDEQKEISKELDKLIADRKVKQEKATELKEQAIKDFEAKIFKN